MNKDFKWKEFVAGYFAGLVNITIVYPIHKVMFRQMLNGINAKKAITQVRSEGIRLLYRGLLPPLCQKTISSGVMFGMYVNYGHMLAQKYPGVNPLILRSSGAILAGINEGFIMTPLERMQTLLQDKHYNSKLRNTYDTVRHIWKYYGPLEYYRGTSMVMLRNALGNILFFAAKEKVETVHIQTENQGAKFIQHFITGGVIGAAISTLVYPINVVKTRMQSRIGGPFESSVGVLRIVWKERDKKIAEMFRGVHLNYIRALISWGITNATFEFFRQLLNKSDNERKPNS